MTRDDLKRMLVTGDVAGARAALEAGSEAEVKEWLWAYPKKNSLLGEVLVAEGTGLEAVELLLEFGAEPQADYFEWSLEQPLMAKALEKGDLAVIKAMVAYGGKLDFVSSGGFNAALHYVHGRDVRADASLLEGIRYLLDSGVDFHVRSSYGETPLRVLAHLGRVDAVSMLVEEGIDDSGLEWAPLHWTVALGSVEDLEKFLQSKPNLESKDSWGWTALGLSAAMGAIDKTYVLFRAGALVGGGTVSPIETAIECDQVEAVEWLIEHGVDVNGSDQFGLSLVEKASHSGSYNAMRALVNAGAWVHKGKGPLSTNPLFDLEDVTAAKILLDAGANPNELMSDTRRRMAGLSAATGLGIDATQEEFKSGWRRKFGQANPDRAEVPFWRAMVKEGCNAYRARDQFGLEFPDVCGNGDPVWCFDRFGQSITLMPDGRTVLIAGEHEDSYDPDFCIYNDVVVVEPDGSFEIYTYPREVFPPTDFHSATQVGDWIYLIGNLGYPENRKSGFTQVYRLEVGSWKMEKVETSGEMPGWISRHFAALVDGSVIQVWGGKTDQKKGLLGLGLKDFKGTFELDLETLVWRRVGK